MKHRSGGSYRKKLKGEAVLVARTLPSQPDKPETKKAKPASKAADKPGPSDTTTVRADK